VADPTSASPPAQRLRLGPDRISLVPVLFAFLGALPLAASKPWLGWLLLLPLACAVWVLRARVVAIPVGVEVCNGLRATRVAWTDVEGVDVPKRGPLKLLRRGGRPLHMTALSRRDLPRLLAVGRPATAPPAGGTATAPPTVAHEVGEAGRR
jgi:hypothetical protein